VSLGEFLSRVVDLVFLLAVREVGLAQRRVAQPPQLPDLVEVQPSHLDRRLVEYGYTHAVVFVEDRQHRAYPRGGVHDDPIPERAW
jgi:hypothetical protein